MNRRGQVLQTGSAGNAQRRYDERDLTFVMGHELQHGFNHPAKLKATLTFLDDIRPQAGANGPVHDYTDELRDTNTDGREDDATEEIAGWNALSRLEKQHNAMARLDRTTVE